MEKQEAHKENALNIEMEEMNIDDSENHSFSKEISKGSINKSDKKISKKRSLNE